MDEDNSNNNIAKSKRISSLRHGAPKASATRAHHPALNDATTVKTTNITGLATTSVAQAIRKPVQYIVVDTTTQPTVTMTQPPHHHQVIQQPQAAHVTTFNSLISHAPDSNLAVGAPSFPFTPAQVSSTPVIYQAHRPTIGPGLPNQQQWGRMQVLPVQFMPGSAVGLHSAATGVDSGTPFFLHESATYSPAVEHTTHAALAGRQQRMLPVHDVPQQFNTVFPPASQFTTLSVPYSHEQFQHQSASLASLTPAINITSMAGDQQTSSSTASGQRSRNPSSFAAQRAASSNANSNNSNLNLSPQHPVATPSTGNTPTVSPLSPRPFQPQHQQYQQPPQPASVTRRSTAHVKSATQLQNIATAPSVSNADEMDEDAVDPDDSSGSFTDNKNNPSTLSAFLLDADDTDETFLDDDFDGSSTNFNDASTSAVNAASRSAALQQFRERRRAAHLQAEKKRRNSIQHGFQELKELLPPLPSEQSGGAGLMRATKAVVLQRAVSYCEMLRKTNSQSNDKLAKLRQEAEGLEIMRDQLQQFVAQAATVAPQQQQQNSENFPSDFTHKDSSARQQPTRPSSSADDAEMYFDVFRGFADALFSSYNRAVSTQDFKSISGTSIQWLEQHCGPQSMQRHVQQAANQVFGGVSGRVDVQAGMQPI